MGVIKDGFKDFGNDVIARMKDHTGESVGSQRGKAILDETGTIQNYGLDKGIYRHNINRADAQRIPRIIQQKPIETNNYGQNVYIDRGINGELRIVTSPIKGRYSISSMYYPRK